MLKTTTWVLDTCGCIVEFVSDHSLPEDSRTHTPNRVFTRCAVHAALTDMAAHFATLWEENPRRNELVVKLTAWVAANAPSWIVDGQIDPSRFSCYWDNSVSPRILHIVITGLTGGQRNTIEALIASRPKLAGRVILD